VDFPLRARGGRKSERAPVLLSKVLAVAGMRRRPVLVVSVNNGKRSAAQAYELGRRLATQEHRVVLVDLDLDARNLSALTEATNPQLVIHELDGAGGPAARATSPILRVVPADLVDGQGAGIRTQRGAPDPLVSAVDSLNEDLRPAADSVLVFVGSVLRRARPAVRLEDRLDAVVLAERGRVSKEALGATIDVLAVLGAHVGAVVLVDASSGRLG
jgi:hypothetical protein